MCVGGVLSGPVFKCPAFSDWLQVVTELGLVLATQKKSVDVTSEIATAILGRRWRLNFSRPKF